MAQDPGAVDPNTFPDINCEWPEYNFINILEPAKRQCSSRRRIIKHMEQLQEANAGTREIPNLAETTDLRVLHDKRLMTAYFSLCFLYDEAPRCYEVGMSSSLSRSMLNWFLRLARGTKISP